MGKGMSDYTELSQGVCVMVVHVSLLQWWLHKTIHTKLHITIHANTHKHIHRSVCIILEIWICSKDRTNVNYLVLILLNCSCITCLYLGRLGKYDKTSLYISLQPPVNQKLFQNKLMDSTESQNVRDDQGVQTLSPISIFLLCQVRMLRVFQRKDLISQLPWSRWHHVTRRWPMRLEQRWCN